jgi:hypothetical protein
MSNAQTVQIEVGRQIELLDPISCGSQLCIQQPRILGSTQVPRVLPRPDAPVGIEDPVRERDRRWKVAPIGPEPAEHRAEAGGIVWWARVGILEVHRLVRPTCEHVVATGGVGVVCGRHRTKDADLIGHRSRLWHQLADREAGNRRADGAKFAPDLGGRVRLGVPRRMLGWPSHQEEQDARLRTSERGVAQRRSRRGNFGPGQVGKAQSRAEKTQPTDAEDFSATPAVAQSSPGAQQTEHGRLASLESEPGDNLC